jgi:hypothetical protein
MGHCELHDCELKSAIGDFGMIVEICPECEREKHPPMRETWDTTVPLSGPWKTEIAFE